MTVATITTITTITTTIIITATRRKKQNMEDGKSSVSATVGTGSWRMLNWGADDANGC
ncbi:hypothetical protein LZ31DRAFT_601275 [Colletotrichum somersetense]|nr:hypothetical protein LZ31DRAFT_601275 [Colletotrichum somersetense]